MARGRYACAVVSSFESLGTLGLGADESLSPVASSGSGGGGGGGGAAATPLPPLPPLDIDAQELVHVISRAELCRVIHERPIPLLGEVR